LRSDESRCAPAPQAAIIARHHHHHHHRHRSPDPRPGNRGTSAKLAGHAAHAKHVTPDAALLRSEIAATRPLAVVMAEKVAALREWARERTVSAD
jgi:hypothetical protein